MPKHGYRFVAPVVAGGAAQAASCRSTDWQSLLRQGAAGTLGAGLAGAIGGLFYGFAVAATAPAAGAVSTVLVLLCVTVLVALVGGAGVAFGIAAADLGRGPRWHCIFGGALGGLIVGGGVRLIGLDAFSLLVGQAPQGITGAGEGALLGAGVGLGACLANPAHSLRRNAAIAAIAGGAAGVFVTLAGGRLMGGSLDRLADAFPDARFSLDSLAAMLGEDGFGFVTRLTSSALEGALFGACIVSAMCWRRGAVTLPASVGQKRARPETAR